MSVNKLTINHMTSLSLRQAQAKEIVMFDLVLQGKMKKKRWSSVSSKLHLILMVLFSIISF